MPFVRKRERLLAQRTFAIVSYFLLEEVRGSTQTDQLHPRPRAGGLGRRIQWVHAQRT